MTAQPAELPSNAPNPTPTNIPIGDKLLKDFKATLEVRWNEFDKATMEEAQRKVDAHILGGFTDAQSERDKDTDFIKAKTAFDTAKAMLEPIQNDAQLKSDTKVLSTVEMALKSITDYLKEVKPEEKGKKINIILAKTTADLSEFKAKITGKEEDKKNAEVAIAAEKAIPRAAIVAATGSELMASAEAKTAINEATGELTSELKKEIGPWGMIFKGVKDVPVKEVATQVKDLAKEYSEKKWMNDPIDKFFSLIKLFFLKLRIGKPGMDLSEHMTPEEMKLAGIKGKPNNSTELSSKIKNEAQEKMNIEKEHLLYVGSYKGLVLMNSIGATLPNSDGKITAINRVDVYNVFNHSNFASQKYSMIESVYNKFQNKSGNWKTELLENLGLTTSGLNPDYVLFACSLIVNPLLQTTKVIHKARDKNPDINIRTLMINLHDEFHPVLAVENVGLSLEDILKDGLSGDPSKLFAPFSSAFHINEQGQYSDKEIQEKAVKLGLNESNFLTTVLAQGSALNINTMTEESIAHLEGADDRTKEKLRKLVNFWYGMKGIIAENFSLGHKAEYADFMKNSNVSLRTVVKFYLATSGNLSETSEVSGPRKMAIYSLIWSDIFAEDGEKRGKLVNQPWMEVITSWIVSPPGITDCIPESVKDVVLKSMLIGKDAILNKLGKYTSEIWYSIPNEYLLGGGVMAILGIYILLQLRYFKGLVTGLAVGTIAASIMGVLWAGIPKDRLKDGLFIASDGTKVSKESLQKEVEKIGNGA